MIFRFYFFYNSFHVIKTLFVVGNFVNFPEILVASILFYFSKILCFSHGVSGNLLWNIADDP